MSDAHVLQVLQPTHGGVAGYVSFLVDRLCRRGWAVTVMAPEDLAVAGDLRRAGATVLPLALRRRPDPVGDLRAAAAIRRAAREVGAEVIHAHSTKAGLAAGLAASGRRTASVYTPHAWAFTMDVALPARIAYAGVEAAMVRGFHGRVITVSEHERREALRWRVGRADRIEVVHTGLAAPSHRPPRDEARAALGLDGDRLVAAWVGRNHRQKQPEQLAPLVRRLGADATLVALGTELAGSEQARAIEAEGGRVLADGTDPGLLYSAADVLVLTSAWESFPLVTLEAMLAGLPVVAYGVGGLPEQVQDGVSGVLVELDDLDGLAEAVRRLAVDPARRSAMGAAARARVADRFPPERTVDRVEAVYRELSRAGRSSAAVPGAGGR